MKEELIMDFRDFKILHSEVIMFYQIIEHDLKYIYCYMHDGDINHNYKEIEDKSLGQIIVLLRDLDNEDHKPLISDDDYKFLLSIAGRRNYYAHEVFVELVYNDNFLYSDKYQNICENLTKDHQKVKRASNILEDIRIDYCKKIRK